MGKGSGHLNRSGYTSADRGVKQITDNFPAALDAAWPAIYYGGSEAARGEPGIALHSPLQLHSEDRLFMAELHYDAPSGEHAGGNWYHAMTSYHWFVLLVASLAWLFDCLDQQLFNLAREARDGSGAVKIRANITDYGYYATAIFLDRLGHRRVNFRRNGRSDWPRQNDDGLHLDLFRLHRPERPFARVLGFWRLSLFDRLGGRRRVCGRASRWWPRRCRVRPAPAALGLLQALSTVGNVSAAGVGYILGIVSGPMLGAGCLLSAHCRRRWQ